MLPVIAGSLQPRATAWRGCNHGLIPAFVECDGGGGKGGVEESCLPAEPTEHRQQAVVKATGHCVGQRVWWPFTEMWRLRGAAMGG